MAYVPPHRRGDKPKIKQPVRDGLGASDDAQAVAPDATGDVYDRSQPSDDQWFRLARLRAGSAAQRSVFRLSPAARRRQQQPVAHNAWNQGSHTNLELQTIPALPPFRNDALRACASRVRSGPRKVYIAMATTKAVTPEAAARLLERLEKAQPIRTAVPRLSRQEVVSLWHWGLTQLERWKPPQCNPDIGTFLSRLAWMTQTEEADLSLGSIPNVAVWGAIYLANTARRIANARTSRETALLPHLLRSIQRIEERSQLSFLAFNWETEVPAIIRAYVTRDASPDAVQLFRLLGTLADRSRLHSGASIVFEGPEGLQLRAHLGELVVAAIVGLTRAPQQHPLAKPYPTATVAARKVPPLRVVASMLSDACRLCLGFTETQVADIDYYFGAAWAEHYEADGIQHPQAWTDLALGLGSLGSPDAASRIEVYEILETTYADLDWSGRGVSVKFGLHADWAVVAWGIRGTAGTAGEQARRRLDALPETPYEPAPHERRVADFAAQQLTGVIRAIQRGWDIQKPAQFRVDVEYRKLRGLRPDATLTITALQTAHRPSQHVSTIALEFDGTHFHARGDEVEVDTEGCRNAVLRDAVQLVRIPQRDIGFGPSSIGWARRTQIRTDDQAPGTEPTWGYFDSDAPATQEAVRSAVACWSRHNAPKPRIDMAALQSRHEETEGRPSEPDVEFFQQILDVLEGTKAQGCLLAVQQNLLAWARQTPESHVVIPDANLSRSALYDAAYEAAKRLQLLD